MTTQVIPGKLHKQASYKPTFGNVAFTWLLVYFLSQLFSYYGGTHHFGYFGLFVLIYAGGLTLRWMFTPKYYTRFVPDPPTKQEPTPSVAAKPIKIKIETLTPPPIKSEAMPMFCPNCGIKHSEEDQYCTACGSSLQF